MASLETHPEPKAACPAPWAARLHRLHLHATLPSPVLIIVAKHPAATPAAPATVVDRLLLDRGVRTSPQEILWPLLRTVRYYRRIFPSIRIGESSPPESDIAFARKVPPRRTGPINGCFFVLFPICRNPLLRNPLSTFNSLYPWDSRDVTIAPCTT